MQPQLKKFVDNLARLKATPNSFNPYATGNPHNAIRRRNLELFLLEVASHKPTIMLLGEAPGYQGCRLTGVPFCSEDILLHGISAIDMFGRDKGYQKTAEYEKIHKEPSATIVWSTLANTKFVPLIWSSFPFHPYQAGDQRTNRAPTKIEVELGKRIFQELATMFKIQRIIAIGNVAHQSLAEVGVTAGKIRHPSHGGKNDFVRGINQLLQSR